MDKSSEDIVHSGHNGLGLRNVSRNEYFDIAHLADTVKIAGTTRDIAVALVKRLFNHLHVIPIAQ